MKMTIQKQLDILEDMQEAGFNVCTCGSCGEVILFNQQTKPTPLGDDKINCPHCDTNMSYSDCPDYYYEGCPETHSEEYPFDEGDDYWTIESYTNEDGQDGILAIQSCWDEESEVIFHENKGNIYFSELESVLRYSKGRYDFVRVYFFNVDDPNLQNGDYFIMDKETGEFKIR